jgi:hypothetical protein
MCPCKLNSKTPYSAHNIYVVPTMFAVNSSCSLYNFNPLTFLREAHLSLGGTFGMNIMYNVDII